MLSDGDGMVTYGEVTMTETVIRTDQEPELDEALLEEAMRGIGSSSRNATLNEVLREYVEAKRDERAEALRYLRRMADEGRVDFAAIEALDE